MVMILSIIFGVLSLQLMTKCKGLELCRVAVRANY